MCWGDSGRIRRRWWLEGVDSEGVSAGGNSEDVDDGGKDNSGRRGRHYADEIESKSWRVRFVLDVGLK